MIAVGYAGFFVRRKLLVRSYDLVAVSDGEVTIGCGVTRRLTRETDGFVVTGFPADSVGRTGFVRNCMGLNSSLAILLLKEKQLLVVVVVNPARQIGFRIQIGGVSVFGEENDSLLTVG